MTALKKIKTLAERNPDTLFAMAATAALKTIEAEKAKQASATQDAEGLGWFHITCEIYRGEETLDVSISFVGHILRVMVESFRRQVSITSSDSEKWLDSLPKDLGVLADAVAEVASHDNK